MREWLTVIVVLLIVGILLDGWRRMRQSRQNAIRMSRSMSQGTDVSKEDLEEFGSELPNGGARVVAQRDERDIEELNRNLRDTLETGRTTAGFNPEAAPSRKAANPTEQVSLNLDESVPMLMEVDEPAEQAESGDGATAQEAQDEPVWEFQSTSAPSVEAAQEETRVEPSFSADEPMFEGYEVPSEPEPFVDVAPKIEPAVEPTLEPEPVNDDANSENTNLEEAEEVLVINVMASQGERFAGQALLDVILECGMRYGAMQIFHRHETPEGEGAVLFSMANMVKPGVFDLNTMAEFETPGVSLFMTLPLPVDSHQAFELMVSTADAICERLGGEMKDENRSVMTKQTIDHCRYRISEFERKRLSKG